MTMFMHIRHLNIYTSILFVSLVTLVLTGFVLMSSPSNKKTVIMNMPTFYSGSDVEPDQDSSYDLIFNQTEPEELTSTTESIHTGDKNGNNQNNGQRMKGCANPPENQTSCRELKFSKDPLPSTALTSFPGSGNTWMRHLIQQLSGIYTGSVYYDTCLHRNGFLGEKVRNSSVIVVKTHKVHLPCYEQNITFTKAIILIRDPLPAFKSEWRRLNGGHVATIAKYYGSTSFADWKNFTLSATEERKTHLESWIKFDGPILIIYYSNLLFNLTEQLDRVINFLHIDVTPDVIQCTLRNNEGLFKRKHDSAPPLEVDDEMRTAINDAEVVISEAVAKAKEERTNRS